MSESCFYFDISNAHKHFDQLLFYLSAVISKRYITPQYTTLECNGQAITW